MQKIKLIDVRISVNNLYKLIYEIEELKNENRDKLFELINDVHAKITLFDRRINDAEVNLYKIANELHDI
jgi:ribosomal protein L18E